MRVARANEAAKVGEGERGGYTAVAQTRRQPASQPASPPPPPSPSIDEAEEKLAKS